MILALLNIYWLSIGPPLKKKVTPPLLNTTVSCGFFRVRMQTHNCIIVTYYYVIPPESLSI